jgi:hypothetical protein
MATVKRYIDTPEQLLALTLSGVCTTCCGTSGSEWSDCVYPEYHSRKCNSDMALEYYTSNMKAGLSFYLLVEEEEET